jgi:hypothetical protein
VVEERKTPVLSARIQRLAEESDAFMVVHRATGRYVMETPIGALVG